MTITLDVETSTIPGPRPWLPGASFLKFRRDPLAFFTALHRAKRLLGEGLLTSEGKAHLKQRRTIQPLFHRQHVQQFGEAMVSHAIRWCDQAKPGTVNVTDEMGALTLAIVGETLFSSNVQGETDEVRAALGDAVQSFGASFLPGIEMFEKLPLPVFVRVRKARERL